MRTPILFGGLLLLLAACSTESTPVVVPGADKLLAKGVPSEEYFNQRAWPAGRIDYAQYTRARREALAGRNLRERGFGDTWTVQGPGNLGGRINTIAVHPDDETIQYVGFSNGGVWKTIDDGATWAPIFDEQPFSSIGAITFDPQNPEIVYVGTGDPNISGFPFIGDGVYRSENGGVSWTHLGLEATRIVSKIIVHPTDPNTLYVGTMGLPMAKNDDRGLYKTTDGGESWEQLLFLADSAGITELLMHPDDPETLYAVGYNRIRNNTKSIIRGPESRLYKTTDGGTSWTPLDVALDAGSDTRIALAQSPTQADRLYALYLSTDFQAAQIMRSEDAGATWTEYWTSDEPMGLSDNALGGFGWYFGDLFAVAEAGEDVLFLPGVDLWMQRPGQDWELATPEWYFYDVHADKHDLAVTPTGRLLLATDGGLYRADNTAGLPNNWEDVDNIPTNQFYRVAHNPHDALSYYGGMQDNGSSGGNAEALADWPRIYGGDGFQMAFPADDADRFYAETQRGNIVRINPLSGGFAGITSSNPILDDDRTNWDTPYLLDATRSDRLLIGTYRVWQCEDDALTGSADCDTISADLTAGGLLPQRRPTIKALAQSPFDPDRFYVGTTNGLVWRGQRDTETWTDVSAGLPTVFVSDVEASPTFPNGVYVSHSGYKDGDHLPRIHRSLDGGDSWEDISANLPDLAINAIYVLPEQNDSVLFVGNDAGVYGSIDAGQRWERVGTNMSAVTVYDLGYNPTTNELVAGTFGRSIQTYSMDSLLAAPTLTSTETPAAAPAQLRLFPNPATDYVELSYLAQEPGRSAEIVVLDMSGRVVHRATRRADGPQNVRLAIENWPAGMYSVKIRMRHTILTQRFLKS